MKNLSDIEIIESVLRGNQADFTLLVNRYKDRAYSLLLRMLKNEMDAEEVLQDAFLKAYRSMPGFRKESKFSTWFYRIVYNTGLSFLGKKQRKIDSDTSSIDEYFDLTSEDKSDEIENIQANLYLYKLIEKLPVRNALVVNLFYIDNMSLNEISQILDISLVNVKVMLHRSRNSLREMLIRHNFVREEI